MLPLVAVKALAVSGQLHMATGADLSPASRWGLGTVHPGNPSVGLLIGTRPSADHEMTIGIVGPQRLVEIAVSFVLVLAVGGGQDVLRCGELATDGHPRGCVNLAATVGHYAETFAAFVLALLGCHWLACLICETTPLMVWLGKPWECLELPALLPRTNLEICSAGTTTFRRYDSPGWVFLPFTWPPKALTHRATLYASGPLVAQFWAYWSYRTLRGAGI